MINVYLLLDCHLKERTNLFSYSARGKHKSALTIALLCPSKSIFIEMRDTSAISER